MDRKNRIFVSNLLFKVLTGGLTVLQAVSVFPKDTHDKSLDIAFHALMHYEADEDFRKNDPLYKEEQDDYLEILANTLKTGDDLPKNIIDEYESLYSETVLYEPDTKENVIKRLLKKINL